MASSRPRVLIFGHSLDALVQWFEPLFFLAPIESRILQLWRLDGKEGVKI